MKCFHIKCQTSINMNIKIEREKFENFLINLEKRKTTLIENYLNHIKIKTAEEAELNQLVQKYNKISKNSYNANSKEISIMIDNKEQETINVMKKKLNEKTNCFLANLEDKLEKEKTCYKLKMELRIKEKKLKINKKMSL